MPASPVNEEALRLASDLATTDLNAMTPLQAMNLLHALQERARSTTQL